MARATIPCNESATKDVFSIPNADHFKCPICLDHFNHNEGVTLKNCLHIFCRKCLIDVIEYSQEAQMGCPFLSGHNKCGIFISESEIRALLPRHLYEAHLQKSLNLAELQIKNSVHCKTPNCIGWVISEDSCVNSFSCPICERHNCLSCMVININSCGGPCLLQFVFIGRSRWDKLPGLSKLCSQYRRTRRCTQA